jgi:glutaredoxin 3
MPIVEIYTTRFCPYCKAAKELLSKSGVAYEEIDIAANWEKRDEMITRANGQATVPQVFCGDVHIGGNQKLEDAVASGLLRNLIAGHTPG